MERTTFSEGMYLGLYGGIMEKKMETTVVYWGFIGNNYYGRFVIQALL